MACWTFHVRTRNFALDYTLKSLEKVLDGQQRHLVRHARVVIKDAAFTLLGRMLDLITIHSPDLTNPKLLEDAFLQIMSEELAHLAQPISDAITATMRELSDEAASLLMREHQRWEQVAGWKLINAADTCGT